MDERPEGVVRAQVEGAVGWIVFENLARHNAMTSEMAGQAIDHLSLFASNAEIRVVVLRGAGERAFMSGGDISKFKETRFNPDSASTARQNSDALKASLLAIDKPVIAMVHGYCLGGGMGLALCADLRFGSKTAKLGIPAALRGIAYNPEGLKRLMDVTGPSVAKDLLFSGRRIDADEAFQFGLLDRVFEPEALEQETRSYANLVAQNAPLSIRASKACIEQLGKPEDKRDLQLMQDVQDAAAASEDFKEATLAFMEKRKPHFRGV